MDIFEPGLNSAIVFAAIWIGLGTVVALCPRAYHPPGALMLLVLLVPLLPYLWLAGHPLLAVGFVAGVASILRWPLYYIGRAILRRFGVRMERDEVERNL